jgi:chorismate mutase
MLEIEKFQDNKILFTGPCGAESLEQVMTTAEGIASHFPKAIFRAGIWKPRTFPKMFEGVGEKGLNWLQQVKQKTGLQVATEVATAKHVESCLEHDIDVLWIGARTTVNPFYVQEIAEALKGIDMPVFIKNPIHPDLNSWIGSMERVNHAGVKKIGAIFRGFHSYEETEYRNVPKWEIALELKTTFPDLQVVCDISHIAGNTVLLQAVAQQAIDLDMNGLMVETHCNPSMALSDAKQQITPQKLYELISSLHERKPFFSNSELLKQLSSMRNEIDLLDEELLQILSRRMNFSKLIGELKSKEEVTIFQLSRWKHIIESGLEKGSSMGLSKNFIRNIFIQIHDESIRLQDEVMNRNAEAADVPAKDDTMK